MAAKREASKESRLIPRGLRFRFRREQADAIVVRITKKYKDAIRKAQTVMEYDALIAKRDAEIQAGTQPLIEDEKKDGPHCL